MPGVGYCRDEPVPCIAAGAIAVSHSIPFEEAFMLVVSGHPADISPGLLADVRRIVLAIQD